MSNGKLSGGVGAEKGEAQARCGDTGDLVGWPWVGIDVGVGVGVWRLHLYVDDTPKLRRHLTSLQVLRVQLTTSAGRP